MFFAERIKEWLRPRPPNEDAQQTKEEAEALSTKVEIGEDGVPGEKGPSVLENQYAPPGYFAPAAPKPSKAAVMIFYMSVAFCIIGCIMIIKGVFKPNLKHADIVPGDLGTGAAVLALGVVLAIVMNELNRREYNRLMAYVTLKVEEMQQSANSRQRINEEHFPADEGYYNTQGLAFGLAGCYRIDPNLYSTDEQNDWHFVQITWNPATETYTWRNRAGVSWSLTPIPKGEEDWDTSKVKVGPECPYFKDGHEFAAVAWEGDVGNSAVSTIKGPWEEAYLRAVRGPGWPKW